MMRQMHVPEDVDEEVYIRHVALFVSATKNNAWNNHLLFLIEEVCEAIR